MFAPSAGGDGGPATATRSRRRRERPKSTESLVQQPKAKRQRVPLTEQTFVNPEATPEMTEVKPDNQVAMLPPRKSAEGIENTLAVPTLRKEPSVRTKKQKHGDRAANKGDGSLVLASTNAYVVSKLPALPDRLRTDSSVHQQADVFSTGYALSLTSTHAVVWPYASTSTSPETFTFNLPADSRPNDPLPVGSLVSPSASSNEPGLVVVTAGTGRVVYWESISSAATFDFMKRERSGVELKIAGMSHGEKVVSITNAESAGFILSFNTGRLAYLNVRDSHGRPSISVQFLRGGTATAAGGLFGSIRYAFSHLSLRGDLAAVHADRSARVGEKNVVALTAKGKLQAWRIHRGGHNECLAEADIRERLIAALHDIDPVSQDFPAESLETLDFTYVPKGLEEKYLHLSRLSEAMVRDDPFTQHLLLLVSVGKKTESRYAMVEVILTSDDCQIGMIRPITSYSAPGHTSTAGPRGTKPRIYLPRPALVAFAIFDHAAVIASVAVTPDTPDMQLQTDNHILPPTFEDVVDFRADSTYEIIGSGIEEMPSTSQANDDGRAIRARNKNPAAILMVQGAGIVRIATTDVDKFASDEPPQVSAKAKLEQAIFYGAKPDTPLSFSQRQGVKFSDDDVGAAALAISQEILSSSTPYISNLPASMDDSLRERSEALSRLMQHLDDTKVQLDRRTRWNLLHNAEKMHVALLLWRRHEAFTTARPADDKKSLAGYIVEFIHQDQKHNPMPDIGEVDRIRHWFVNDISSLELFVAWAYEVIKVLYRDRLIDEARVSVMIYEAVQINTCTHVAAIDFRKSNMGFYGLQGEKLRLGILRDGYGGLVEPWTGCQYVANNMKRLTELVGLWSSKDTSSEEGSRTSKKPDPAIMAKIVDGLPSLIDCMLTSVLEQARWAAASEQSSEHNAIAKEFFKTYDEGCRDKPISLARSGKWDDGARIAEKHGSLVGLSVILLEQIDYLHSQPTEVKSHLKAKITQLEDCFSRYGQDFAFPVYEYLIETHGVEAVLAFDMDKMGFKTQFLRSRPELARISWINDVQQEEDLEHAAETLIDLAMQKEQQAWNKKIELSLGKLALLAELEDKTDEAGQLRIMVDESRHDGRLQNIDRELVVITIQDLLYNQVRPSVADALDDAAALNLAMEVHSTNIPRRQKALLQVFEDSMGRLLRHEALDAMSLVDLLTLIAIEPAAELQTARPFWLALKVAESSCHDDEIKEAKRLIWRRAYIRDDWAKINDTQLMGDREVVEAIADTELCGTMADCIRFQDTRDPFQPLPPQEALGAFTTQLDRRFRDFDATFQSKLQDAMRAEDKVLQQSIDKHRLAEWATTVFTTAEKDVALDLDEATKARTGAEVSAVAMFGNTQNSAVEV